MERLIMLMIANRKNLNGSHDSFNLLPFVSFVTMKKLQSSDKVVKVDKDLGIAWILLPPDPNLGGFQGISPRIMDEEKFLSAKKRAKKEAN
jgi:hypothetical protein